MIKLVPQLERAVTGPPSGLIEWPRLCCIVFVKEEDDPTETERVRVHSWRAPNLRDVCYNLDKNYSRTVAKQAIPLFVSEINGLNEPGEAARKFRLMIAGPDVVQPFLNVLDMGITDDDDGDLLRKYLGQLLNGGDEEDRVFGS